jgi:beta-fructofuranosidase
VDLTAANEADVGYNCSTSCGAAARGVLGPFGYFYESRGVDGAAAESA